MGEIKNKTKISTKSKPLSTRRKNAASKKIQHALSHEFFELKDIAGCNNEYLATLLGTTQRTILNKKKSGEPFDISQTERLRKLTRLFGEGNEVFGNKEQFNEWLQKPSYGLDDTPSELLKQPGGLDKVLNELNSIKFGDAV